MNREVRIRYTFKRKEDGHIWQDITPIECLEGKGDKPFILNNFGLWDLIGRGLWTGLKDKNNIDIYEGDIVTYSIEDNDRDWHTNNMRHFPVEFLDGQFVINYGTGAESLFKVVSDKKVIRIVCGNIYENPELLNKNL